MAVSVYVLVATIRKQLGIETPLYAILQILSVLPFDPPLPCIAAGLGPPLRYCVIRASCSRVTELAVPIGFERHLKRAAETLEAYYYRRARLPDRGR